MGSPETQQQQNYIDSQESIRNSIINFQPGYTDSLAFPHKGFEESILGKASLLPYSDESTSIFIPQIVENLEISKLRFIEKVDSGELDEAQIQTAIQRSENVERFVIKSLITEAQESGAILHQDADPKKILETLGPQHTDLLQELYLENSKELFIMRLYIGEVWNGDDWKIVPTEKDGETRFVLIQQSGETFPEENGGMVVLYTVADLTDLAAKNPPLVQENILAYHRSQIEIQMYKKALEGVKLLRNEAHNVIPKFATEIASSPNPQEDLYIIRLLTDVMAQTSHKIKDYSYDLNRERLFESTPHWRHYWEEYIDQMKANTSIPIETLLRNARIPHIMTALEKERERINLLAKRDASEYPKHETGSDIDILHRPMAYTDTFIEFNMGLRDIELNKLPVPRKRTNTSEDLTRYGQSKVAMDLFLQKTGITRDTVEELVNITKNAFKTYQIFFNLLYLQKTHQINIATPGVRHLVLETTGTSEEKWQRFISLINKEKY